jgi:hypothetical protein
VGRTLSVGASGQDVRALQDALNFQIRRGTPLSVDGVFGPKTEARVREFQRVTNLKVDGVAGPLTQAQLFEVTEVTLPILFMPNLRLTPPTLGQRGGFGIQPPRLIPPLQWPGPPVPAPPPFTFGGGFRLGENSLGSLPASSAPANALGIKLTVPTRKDPEDPAVRTRKTIAELIDDLPVNSKFKALLLSQVPNPVTKVSPPSSGFDWGVEPLFNPLDPKGFGLKGNARFTVRVTEGRGGLPNMVFGAWGEGKAELNFESRQGRSRPLVSVEGQLFLGVEGTF